MQIITAQFICRTDEEVEQVTESIEDVEQFDNYRVLRVDGIKTIGLSITIDGKKHEWTI